MTKIEMKIGRTYKVKTSLFRLRSFTGIYKNESLEYYHFRLDYGNVAVPKGKWARLKVQEV